MGTTADGQWITVRNEYDDIAVEVFLVAGTRTKGIGYLEGKPVYLFGGVIWDGPRRNEKVQWGDGSGRYWRVDERGQWFEFGGMGAGSGWRCE